MKTTINQLLFVLVLFMSFSSFGQELEDDNTTRNVKNEFSFELLQIVNGVYQVSYERHIWNNFSAAIALGYKGKEGLIKLSGIDGEKIKTGDIYYTGFQIVPEIRYYINGTNKFNQKLNGFYLGLYYKYSSYTSELTGRYIASDNTNYDLAFDMDLDISSVGLLIGYKLAITKRFTIDFMIAGPGSGDYKFKIVNKKDLPDEFYDDLNEALEDYDLLDFINGDFRFSNVNNKSNFNTFSFRYGIAVGYTF
ncbi:DUF3575 domain-containing protein [Hanstruepera flava]|uniref:DUF3575 domain-containing protein n=1 Tax=Hanstruepera flava TaxID=2930218 RepID=UPI0020278F2C|nr:DUF3575 domain-containing protein [Hanstruepera flava]